MTGRRAAELGTSVYQLEIDGRPGALVRDFHYAMLRVGYMVAGSDVALTALSQPGSFPGLATPELSGSLFHRIRYEAVKQRLDVTIVEHQINGSFYGPSAVSHISLLRLFDPAYEVQAALYDVAAGDIGISDADERIRCDIAARVQHSDVSPGAIVEHVLKTQSLMGNISIITPPIGEVRTVVRVLPELASRQFLEKASRAFSVHVPTR